MTHIANDKISSVVYLMTYSTKDSLFIQLYRFKPFPVTRRKDFIDCLYYMVCYDCLFP